MEHVKKCTLTSLQEAQQHLSFLHNLSDGWITLAKKEPSGAWRQYHYNFKNAQIEIKNWIGEDVYISQNTFYKPQRRLENIRQLRAIYVDVDCYKKGYSNPQWLVKKVEMEIFEEGVLPRPNAITYSGRGVIFIWLIKPVPYQALPLWQAIQQFFVNQLLYVGADSQSMDATRVFRVAGSINTKNQKRVYMEQRHQQFFCLREIQKDYLPPLQQKKEKVVTRLVKKGNMVQLFNLQQLHYNRLKDLLKLVELREYDIKGYRELCCFLYRYWMCCISQNPKKALQKTLEFNAKLTHPLTMREVRSATKSAEKAWLAKINKLKNDDAISKGYPGAGYNISNKKLIDWLAINESEQRQLQTIISTTIKKQRKLERDREYQRLKRGSDCQTKYLKKLEECRHNQLQKLHSLLTKYPSAPKQKIADLMGISRSHLYRLIKKSKSSF